MNPKWFRKRSMTLLGATAAAVFSCNVSAQAFDFDRGNAPIELVFATAGPVAEVTSNRRDAPIIFRATFMLLGAQFDAIAPYHRTAIGIYSRLPRRPASEGATDRNRNIATLYASLEVLNSLYPAYAERWNTMMTGVGLDPNATTNDLSSPIGIGRAAGKAWVAARLYDGMNQTGTERGRRFHLSPYSDYTEYEPVNTAFDLKDPSRWQPMLEPTKILGNFAIQQFITPQWSRLRPITYYSPSQFRLPPPVNSNPRGPGGWAAYKAQVDKVLSVSATLTDEQKLAAELFEGKIDSLGASAAYLWASRGWNVEQFVHYDFLVNLAQMDAGVAVWSEKLRYDAVRPVSAIRRVHGNNTVTAWGGPGKGTVRIPADQWRSYLPVGNHAEYPSGTTCFCTAQAQASRRFLNSDTLGWSVTFAPGSALEEPGVTPRVATTLSYPTWTKYENDCGQSRLWGGVHFQPAIDGSKALCRRVADGAVDWLRNRIAGHGPIVDSSALSDGEVTAR